MTRHPTTTSIRRLFTPSSLTLRPEADLHAAAVALFSHRLPSAPVTDEEGFLQGILSEQACLTGELSSLYHRQPPRSVAGAMTTAVHTTTPDTTIARAAARFVEQSVQILPVVDPRGRLLGELRRSRVVQALQPRQRRPPEHRPLYLSALGRRTLERARAV